jgi:phosphoribosylaminoimidazole (AIR) synthetase
MEHVFNLGLGMLAVVAAADTSRALEIVHAGGRQAWAVGEIRPGHGRVTLGRS